MPVFIDVEYLQGWSLFVVLSDGTTGALDLTPGAPSRCSRRWIRSGAAPGSSSIAITSWSGPPAASCRPTRSIT